ncbi:MAG: FRG domain-containing protein [Hyphomicrobiaceae bacterium]
MIEGVPSAYLDTLEAWPTFGFGNKDIDGLLPVCRVSGWRGFQDALSHEYFNRPGAELIYRGHRRHEWQLTPTLGRYTTSGVILKKQADRQLEEFRYAMRGRGARFDVDEDPNELWAYGQHHGLATPLLDWTKSPFVALFFAFADRDEDHEQPNPSRPIFILNRTAMAELDETLIVQPMRSDHTRLINQAGLFTISPLGEKTLITHIMDLLAETKVDMDDAAKVAEYICKIHIPCDANDRLACMRTLKMMNLHHGTLFPDPIGASRYCNDWCGSRIDEFNPAAPPPTANEDGQPSRLPETVHTEPAAQEATAATHGMLVAILEEHLSGTILPSRDRLLEQARLLDENFAEQAGIDWMRRPTQEAQLR